MRARGWTVLLGLVGAVLVLSGCAGAPVAPASPFPPRPKNLDLSNVDLCATLTAEQKRQRGIDEESESVATTPDGAQAPTCNWSDNETSRFYAIQVFQGSAAIALQTRGSRILSIYGFGAVRGPNDNPTQDVGTPPFCQIPIDASDTQSIRVQYESDRGDASNLEDQEAACVVATRLAEDILVNLTR